jgi:hypothetical protein
MRLHPREQLGDGAAPLPDSRLRLGAERTQQLATEREIRIVDRSPQPRVLRARGKREGPIRVTPDAGPPPARSPPDGRSRREQPRELAHGVVLADGSWVTVGGVSSLSLSPLLLLP